MAREPAVIARRASARLGLALLASVALAGCGTSVKLLPENLSCPVTSAQLDTACTAPATLANGATFAQLVQAGIDDRAALRACESRRAELALALRTCNQAVERYLGEVREINKANAAKP